MHIGNKTKMAGLVNFEKMRLVAKERRQYNLPLLLLTYFSLPPFCSLLDFFLLIFFIYICIYKCAFFIYWRPSQEIRNLTNMCSAPLRGISDTIIAMNDTEQPGKYATMKRGKGSIFIKIYFISPIRIYNYYSLYF